ncbi:MAG TPA: FkbM family methyltransferase [Vicinamibacterales bacterium]|nr:FkbM family methyltransferase [Vicinamibacterales bacterium]
MSLTDEGTSTSLLGHLKNQVVRAGSEPRMIRAGALKGLRMDLDLTRQAQVYLGLYERELYGWLRVLGQDAASALDVGAADGAYSLYFLKRTKARAVYAFEPDPAAREVLASNLRLNDLEGDPRLQVSGSPVGTGKTPATIALDALHGHIELPCLAKVDVEGSEADVLEGAACLLRRGGVSWIIETHSLPLEEACIRQLESHDLTVRIVSPAWWRFAVPEARPIPHNRWLIAHAKGLALP